MKTELLVKPWWITVQGFAPHLYVAGTRQKAIAEAWQNYQILGKTSFRDFLKIARAVPAEIDGFGKPITVAGERAFRVGEHGQYVRFVRPGSDRILLTHPADVGPEVAVQ